MRAKLRRPNKGHDGKGHGNNIMRILRPNDTQNERALHKEKKDTFAGTAGCLLLFVGI